jgi:ArsR family metal-binding transcriptional regulator
MITLGNPIFKIYRQDFTCDKCGEQTCMGIIGYSSKYHKICDFCLVNELEASEKTSSHPAGNHSSKKGK